MNTKLTVWFLLLICIINFTIDLTAQTRYVDISVGTDNVSCGTIGAPCRTIQYTVDNIAQNNDVVYIKSGVYSLPIGVSPNFGVVELPVNKSLHFIGDSVGRGAVIDGADTRRGFHYEHSTNCPLSNGANGIAETRVFTFDNLSFKNCYYLATRCGSVFYAEGGGISITSDPLDSLIVSIRNSSFSENRLEDLTTFNTNGRSSSGAGVFIEGRNSTFTSVTVNACNFNNNEATQNDNGGRGGAIAFRRVNYVRISNSYFCGNIVEGVNANNGDLRFQRNSGSAVHFFDDNNALPSHYFEIDRCSFVNNVSTSTDGSTFAFQSAGAVCLSRSDGLNGTNNAILSVSNSHFYNNQNELGISHLESNGGTIDTVSIGNNVFGATAFNFLGPDIGICKNESLTLGANLPPGSYLWSDGSTDSVLNINVFLPDTFWVEVTIAECTFRDSIIVDTASTPSLNLGNDTSLCPPFNYVLNAGSRSSSYLWQNGSTDSSFTATNTGVYSVTLTSSNGCIAKDTLVIKDSLSINLGADTSLCLPFNYVLDPGAGFVSYLWQDGSSASSFLATSPGSYSVTVSTNSGCVASDTIEILSSVSVNLGNDTAICSAFNYALSPGSGFSSYLWQDGSSDSTLVVTNPGLYWVRVSSSSGCFASDTIIISNSLSIDLGADTTFCSRFIYEISPGYTFASYRWQDGSTRPSFLATVPGEYSVDVTTIDGCIASDTINVLVSPFILDLGKDTSFCSTISYALDANPNFNTYRWQDGSQFSTYYITEPGVYYLDVTTDSGCFASDTIVAILDTFSINLGLDQTFCTAFNYELNPGSGYSTYLWQDSSSNQRFNVTETGNYSVEVTNSNGCKAKDSVAITAGAFSINLGKDTILCVKEKFSYSLSPGLEYQSYVWQDGNTDANYTVSESGNYSVLVTKASGCAATDTIDIVVNRFPLDLGVDTVLCSDSTFQLNANVPNVSYRWQDGTKDSSYLATETGSYWVEIESNNCRVRDSVEVVFSELVLPTTNRDTICAGELMSLDATFPNSSYLWQDGSVDSVYSATKGGVYFVSVSNACGSAQKTFILEGDDCNCTVFFPNAFSPNGDNLNDVFVPVFNCGFEEYDFQIFNRWGEMVYKSTIPTKGWDGKQNGSAADLGVYVYKLRFKSTKSTYSEAYEGKVVLTK